MSRTHGPETNAMISPAFGPVLAVRLAAVTLPTGEVRERYRAEFLSELYDMRCARQMSHAVRILLCAWALRRAVTASAHDNIAAEEAAMTVAHEHTVPLRCRFNLHHHWVYRWTEDGNRYRQCAVCGKDDSKRNGPLDGYAVP